MNPIEAMHVFVRVAELGSFTRAAESLGLPKASVSTAVQQLETTLGTRLLQRTTRRVEMSQDGRAYYERSKDLLADFDELQAMFQHGARALRGRLRVDMPTGVARSFVVPQLPRFLAEHPQLEIELSSTDRRVDLVREGFDCVLRIGFPADPHLIARPLGALRMANVASPAYLREYGTPQTLDDLASHRLVHYVGTLGAKSPGFEYPHDGGYASVAMAGAVTVNNAEAYEAACLAGLGIIQAPDVGVRHLVLQGALVEVLPHLRAEPMPMALLYPNRRNLPRRVQAFMQWLVTVLRPHFAA
ncbi:MAG TPA: LysR family transcriptional regulator [Tahibacter sp.]|nr:LysR family transcriptional regulator [Tahibacter sp.]